ncbi:DUF1353 domain-containing protein [Pseudomonas sp. SCB32]|uniref:DUF1353 domain-containing protein n=1 Tax=Pseudomonas sp. SCB32 TaxID=2653853 RepID=UPI001263F8A3|nr:DUF1353 domain-containing protein [Pseudomonas sp. SCB32]
MPFDSSLDLRSLPLQDAWRVLRPLQLRLADGRLIVVPVGYVTDLASVPRIAWRIVPRDYAPARAPAVVHDYIYTNLTHRFTKAEADRIFYDALLEQGTPKLLAWLMWCCVRVGGRGNWGR